MLIKCPECGKEISDKAISCPNCGFPMAAPAPVQETNVKEEKKQRIRNGKPTRLPNNFGSINHLRGKLRKPFRAVKTMGWEIDADTGRSKQKRVTIGYFETYEAAFSALAAFNESPYDIKADNITFQELYEKWSETYYPTVKPSTVRTNKAAYKYCQSLYNMRMKDLRTSHLEGVILSADTGDPTKTRIRNLFHMLFKYGIAHDVVEKDYSAYVFAAGNPVKNTPQKERTPFSDDEVAKLWDNVGVLPYVDMILIDIYSGWRATELSELQVADVDLEKDVMIAGMKSDAGRNRIVPTHPLIKPLIEKRVAEAQGLQSDFLFNDKTGPMRYTKYEKRFKQTMELLGMQHSTHEARHTFITKAKFYGMDNFILSRIAGHKIGDLTERVYTHRSIDELKREMCKIIK